MSANRLRFDGLDELRAALRDLPTDLKDDADVIIGQAAEEAASEITSKYPRRTGKLADSVTVVHSQPGPYGTRAIVKNTAKHAHLFEWGTQARHTSIGANRGSMPPGRVFVPVMIRRRRAMYEDLKTMVTTHGLVVSGDA